MTEPTLESLQKRLDEVKQIATTRRLKIDELNASVMDRRIEVERLKAERRNQWTYAALVCLVVAVVSYSIGVHYAKQTPQFVDFGPRTMATETSPASVLSSVEIGGCSATVVARKGKLGVAIGCAHAHYGAVGTKHKLRHPHVTGAVSRTETTATLIDVDYDRDLTKWSFPADGILGISPVCEEIPDKAEFQVCGYPGGRGPKYHKLHRDHSTFRMPEFTPRWRFTVADGGAIYGGNSGCGIFADDKYLVGVLTAREEDGRYKTLYCCSHDALLEFCRRRCPGWDGCPNGICPPPRGSNAPPSNMPPGPNVPVVPPSANVPPPVPDDPTPAPPPAEEAPPAPQPKQPKAKKPAPPVGNPQANVPAPYDGSGRPPKGLRTPRQRSHWISVLLREMGMGGGSGADLTQLQQEITQLQQQVQALQNQIGQQGNGGNNAPPGPGPAPAPAPAPPDLTNQITTIVQQLLAKLPKPQDGKDGAPGPAGPAGPAGKDGAPGKDGEPGTITAQLVDDQGKVVKTIPNVEAGGTLILNKKHFVSK